MTVHGYPLRLRGEGRVTGFVVGAGHYPRGITLDAVLFRRGRGFTLTVGCRGLSVWRRYCYVSTSHFGRLHYFWGGP